MVVLNRYGESAIFNPAIFIAIPDIISNEPVSNVQTPLPILTVNREFMTEFLSAEAPCFALGLLEVENRERGFLAMRPEGVIPSDVTALGFNFGHGLLGTSQYEVIQFGFEFYGFGIYNVLINPNNPLVRTVLTTMVGSGDYFFFALNADRTVTSFRSDIGQEDLAGLKTNFPRIQNSTTTDAQYRAALSSFAKNPQPPGTLFNWVCRDNPEYLDLSENRLDMNPAPK